MENSDIKYCVTTFIDLLGISSHLEIGNDLRTNIGQEVINRLNNLEEAINIFLKEKKKYPDFFPKNIHHRRINDALILTLDLPEFLTPRIGETVKEGITLKEYMYFFPNYSEFSNEADFEMAYNQKLTESILELTQFIGLSARIHSFINRKENDNHYPGAKTVISSGYRRSFITKSKEEDFLSANFSFSNAYLAESTLKGCKFYVDNNILKLIGSNRFTRNLLKYSSFLNESNYFNPFDDDPPSIDRRFKPKIVDEKEVLLFRKQYLFREINPHIIVFLQFFPQFLPYLQGVKNRKKGKKGIVNDIFNCYNTELQTNEILNGKKSFFFFRFDLEDDIRSVRKFI